MRVRCLRRWQNWRADRIYDVPDGVANLLTTRIKPPVFEEFQDDASRRPQSRKKRKSNVAARVGK